MHVLAEEARDVHARRRERVVDRPTGSAPRRSARVDQPSRARVEVRALHVGERRRDDDAARMVRLRVASRAARGNPATRRARRSSGTCPSRSCSRRCARGNRRRRARAATSCSNSSFGLTFATTRFARRSRRSRARRRQRGRARRSRARRRRPVRIVDAARGALLRHRLRDRAHAADRAWPHCPRLPFTSPNT